MQIKGMRIVIDFLLIGTFLTVALTGLLADVVGEGSPFHRYSAYSFTALVGVHLYLNRWALLAGFSWPKKEAKKAPSAAPSPTPWGKLRWSRRGFLWSGLGAAVGFVLGKGLPWGQPPTSWEGEDLGKRYHQWSQPGPLAAFRRPLDWGLSPPPYKSYPGAPVMALPRDFSYRGLSVEEAIQLRRSIRDYTDQPIPLKKFSHLLYMAGGITEPRRALRAAPSAGALYPIEIYPIVFKVEGLAPGVYHYEVREYALSRLQEGDFRPALFRHCAGQELVLRASAIIALTGIFQRTRWKYQDRYYRYVLLEAGHIGQNIYLAATSLGLGTCAIGAFFDQEINRLLGIDGAEEAVLYLLAVGTIQSAGAQSSSEGS